MILPLKLKLYKLTYSVKSISTVSAVYKFTVRSIKCFLISISTLLTLNSLHFIVNWLNLLNLLIMSSILQTALPAPLLIIRSSTYKLLIFSIGVMSVIFSAQYKLKYDKY